MKDIEEEPASPTEIPSPSAHECTGGEKKENHLDSGAASQTLVRQTQCVKVEENNVHMSNESIRLPVTAGASPRIDSKKLNKGKFLLDLTKLDRMESFGDEGKLRSSERGGMQTDTFNNTGFHIRSLHPAEGSLRSRDENDTIKFDELMQMSLLESNSKSPPTMRETFGKPVIGFAGSTHINDLPKLERIINTQYDILLDNEQEIHT